MIVLGTTFDSLAAHAAAMSVVQSTVPVQRSRFVLE